MSSNAEEQEMEGQALEAIFDQNFHILSNDKWMIEIFPEQNDSDDPTIVNHVACKLHVTLPADYPEASLPELDIEIIQGLAEEHKIELLEVANSEARANEGTSCIFAIAERIREWLITNNVKGLDDISMHAIMLRKEKQKQLLSQSNTIYESHQTEEEMTQAEMEELMVTKRRAEGTPCTREHFLQWQQKFDDEMKIFSETQEQQSKENSTGDSKRTKALAAASDEGHKAGRLTGYEFFSDKTNNYDAVEAAAERAETDAAYVDKDEEDANNDVDEALFDDDVDLDDLSFDDDDEEEEDDDDDDVNI